MPTEAIVKNQDRIQVLDVIRGFALGGILIINAMSILAVKGSTSVLTGDMRVLFPDKTFINYRVNAGKA